MLLIWWLYITCSAKFSSSSIFSWLLSCLSWFNISRSLSSSISSAFNPFLWSCGDPPDLFDFSWDLLPDDGLLAVFDDADAFRVLDDDDALLGLSCLVSPLSASSIGGPGLFTDSDLATLVTCEYDPSWPLCIPLLSRLSLWLSATTGAALSNENVSFELIT